MKDVFRIISLGQTLDDDGNVQVIELLHVFSDCFTLAFPLHVLFTLLPKYAYCVYKQRLLS